MPEDNVTPEEKLLKIIENPETKKEVPPQSKVIDAKDKNAGLWLSQLKNLHIGKDILKYITLQTFNRGVLGICAALTVLFMFDFVNTAGRLNQRMEKIISEASMYGEKAKAGPMRELSAGEFAVTASRRNIFTFIPISASAVASPESEVMKTISNLKLVGIMWSDRPQAMIESSKNQKTYLVGIGEAIEQLKVKNILRDKVVLEKDGQEWELR